jgi:prolyl-tRNA editing enzyme YbaK/EbsC (Cys-tRNA(Pro) deacylase)
MTQVNTHCVVEMNEKGTCVFVSDLCGKVDADKLAARLGGAAVVVDAEQGRAMKAAMVNGGC